MRRRDLFKDRANDLYPYHGRWTPGYAVATLLLRLGGEDPKRASALLATVLFGVCALVLMVCGWLVSARDRQLGLQMLIGSLWLSCTAGYFWCRFEPNAGGGKGA